MTLPQDFNTWSNSHHRQSFFINQEEEQLENHSMTQPIVMAIKIEPGCGSGGGGKQVNKPIYTHCGKSGIQ